MGSFLSALAGRFTRTTTTRQPSCTYDDLKTPLLTPCSSYPNEKTTLEMVINMPFSSTLLPLHATRTTPTSIDQQLPPSLPPFVLQEAPTILYYPPTETESDAKNASSFVDLFLSTPSLPDFQDRLSSFRTTSWTSGLALAILRALESTIKVGVPLGAAGDVVERARKDVLEWVGEHPILAGVLVTIVALGVLSVVAPWVVEGLGFGVLGPRLGSFAARWQSLYGGATPGGSIFAFLQRMGMVGWRISEKP